MSDRLVVENARDDEKHQISTINCTSTSTNNLFNVLAGDIPNEGDQTRQIEVATLIQEVPETIFERGASRSTQGTLADFFRVYPNLQCVPLSGDGNSCQFEAVAEAACGSVKVAGLLRTLAVNRIDLHWDSIADFVLGEVADQTGIPVSSLDKAKCLSLLSGTNGNVGIWGNHCTLAQLSHIVKKNIVILTLTGIPSNTFLASKDALKLSTSVSFRSFTFSLSNLDW